MHDVYWIAAAMLIIIVGLALNAHHEGFTDDTRDADVNKYVSKIYVEILERNPTPTELTDHRQVILAGNRTFDDVRQRLTDSAEYRQMIKMQSNRLMPEMPRMISDSKLLRKLADIYLEERKEVIPPKMVLPIKDLFIKLDYSETALRYMLRSEKWAAFQENILVSSDFSEKSLDTLIEKSFGSIDKIEADAVLAAKDENNGASGPTAANVSDKIDRMIADEDSDMTNLVEDIQKHGHEVFNKDQPVCQCAIAPSLCDVHRNVAVQPQTHFQDGKMVLRPEFAWSVPQQRPPVCTSLGRPSLVQPVMMASTTLMGTPLDEANDTAVGSIMPQFIYKEYVSITDKEECASSKPTS